jgi:hypothetical protein
MRSALGNGVLPDQDRSLTVREAARFQSFPDTYKFLGPRAYPSMSKSAMPCRVYQPAICTHYPDGRVVLQRPQLRQDCTRVYNEWTVMKDGTYKSFALQHFV